MISPEQAEALQWKDYWIRLRFARLNAIKDGLVEVEQGHFVRPGEPYRTADGRYHKNPVTETVSPLTPPIEG